MPFLGACNEAPPPGAAVETPVAPPVDATRLPDIGLRLWVIRDNGAPVSNVDFLVWPVEARPDDRPAFEVETAGAGEALLWLKPGRYRVGFARASWRPELGDPPLRTITIPPLVPAGGVVELVIQLRPN